MNEKQDKTMIQKAWDQLEEWAKKPLNICGDPKDWPMICDWITHFLNELSKEGR